MKRDGQTVSRRGVLWGRANRGREGGVLKPEGQCSWRSRASD